MSVTGASSLGDAVGVAGEGEAVFAGGSGLVSTSGAEHAVRMRAVPIPTHRIALRRGRARRRSRWRDTVRV